jgi:hypothetical protein
VLQLSKTPLCDGDGVHLALLQALYCAYTGKQPSVSSLEPKGHSNSHRDWHGTAGQPTRELRDRGETIGLGFEEEHMEFMEACIQGLRLQQHSSGRETLRCVR